MKSRLVLSAIFILLAASLALLAPFPAIAHERPKDYTNLITDLTAAGAIIETGGEIEQPFFSVKGRQITLNGGEVQVFEYPSHTKASAEAARISPDGYSVGTAQVDWITKPHFYNSGKLIILYLGESEAIESLIESVVGSQFAGR